MAVFWLFEFSWIYLLAGGVLLIWIAYNLLTDDKDHDDMKPSISL